MDESRRERKKRQTRRLIADTAIRLFSEQGYEQTTVAQIAAAADVATKTFFNHFPSKEAVLFPDTGRNAAVAVEVIAGRKPGEPVADLLARAYEAMLAGYRAESAGRDDRTLMELYTRLIMTVPALQAKALRLEFAEQRTIAGALREAYPDTLDAISAAAVVGAMAGAVQGAALTSLEAGQSEKDFWKAMRRGIDIGLYGLGG
ncbi:TetR/AcrR family transcriptional regulator [Amycolatopsis sp. NPDC059021]|uniref:TetR/AcrR family transcriptional regulator n=1 Tax=Amycolatopsis sp. NPDC059021 TaxID=3346704 RepID=UPI0036721D12